ncbi:MAG: murein hydrolase activator EnvC family protein, partial [Gammaproteobacteria bacterium]
MSARKTTLDRQLAASRDAAQAAEKELSTALRAAFTLGRQPAIKLALEGDDPASVARLLGYYGYYSKARANRIAELTASIARYRKLQDELAATQKDLEQTAASRQKTLTTLEKNRGERRTLIAKLAHDIANKNARIATLNRDAERLEKVINSVSQDIAEVPSTLLDQVN